MANTSPRTDLSEIQSAEVYEAGGEEVQGDLNGVVNL
jgi:hypothetical protein